MPLPTILFLNSHEDPATFMALNAYWMEFRKRNYIFTDEVERECTLDSVKKAHQSRLTLLKMIQQGYALPKFTPHKIKVKLEDSMRRCPSSVHALQFLSQLYPEEYQAIES